MPRMREHTAKRDRRDKDKVKKKRFYTPEEAAHECVLSGSDDGRLNTDDSNEESSDEERERFNEGEVKLEIRG